MTITSHPYTILPFRFSRLRDDGYLLVSEAGEFMFIDRKSFLSFTGQTMNTTSADFLNLKGKHFVTDTELSPVIDLLSTKYRTKKAFLRNFTVLHMIVITARCNHRCRYCHASSEEAGASGWDMTPHIARKVVDMIFQAPSPTIKIEFQGGEPLLNWETVKETVRYAEKRNRPKGKQIEFVLCTNLTLMDREKLAFIKDQGILVSTSLDGSQDLHDANRILRNGESSYNLFVEKLALTRDFLGKESVSALMTTSLESIGRMRDIVDEYIRQGFNGIFLRALNPFGYAKADYKTLGYDIEAFVEAYKDVLTYIIELNIKGIYFEEYYTTLLLKRILTPFSTGFMDLQSPAGAGICGAIYDQNGDVYPCDEGRMLAKTGDKRFRLGNVICDNFFNIFGGSTMKEITSNSCVETLPGCASCVFQIYCGADPIRNYAEQGEIVGHRPTSMFCKKNKAIFEYLFGLFRDNNEDVIDVFWSWITRRPLQDIRHVELPGNAT